MNNKYGCNIEDFAKALTKIKNNKVYLYAMSGKMGAGKDTIGDLIKENLEKEGQTVNKFSYSSPMKKEMQHMVNMSKQGHSMEEIAKELNTQEDAVIDFFKILDGASVYERSDKARLAIQYWGTDIRRKQNKNYWIDKLVEMIVKEVNQENSVFISDVRFENEANSIIDLGGKVVRLEVDETVRVDRILKRDNLRSTKEHLNHLSEIALDNYVFDKVFDNSGDLKNATEKVTQYIKEVK